MSRTVDERVVKMEFDNAQFERGVKETMTSLESLKKSSNLDGISKGIEGIGKAAEGVDVSKLGGAVETVKSKFSALEVVAITALANITNSAINAGKQMLESLTLEPIKDGFAEYELKMGSVQTIMASTGADINTVNKYLEDLNTYSDKTIYSFSDMTSSIGKFTNAGVSLDDAVNAIKGISNEAAVSGANAQEASRAMYNFAQALSSGSVKLIDWKSIENANMATVEFKQALLDTAVAMGTVVKEGDEYQSTTTDNQGKISDLFTATSNFNDSLKAQWMTTDVLIQTLSNYSTDVREMSAEEKKAYEEKLRGVGYTEEQIKAIEELGQKAYDSAQDIKTFSQLMDTLKESVGSGWAQTFEILFGDLEEAKELWTGVGKVVGGFINAQSQARNELLKGWDALGGRVSLINGIKNAFNGLVSILKPIGQAFRDVFPPTTAQQLFNITKKFEEFTKKLIISGETAEKIRTVFRGFFSVIATVGTVISNVISAALPVAINLFTKMGSVVLDLGSIFGEFISGVSNIRYIFDDIREYGGGVSGVIQALGVNIRGLVYQVGMLLEKITGLDLQDAYLAVASGVDAITNALLGLVGAAPSVESVGDTVKTVFGGIGTALSKAVEIVKPICKTIIDALKQLATGIGNAFKGNGLDSMMGLVNGGILAGVGIGINKFIKSLQDIPATLNDSIGGIGDLIENFKGIIGGVQDCLSDFQANIKAGTLIKIAAAIGILAASIVVLGSIDTAKLAQALGAITVLFAELTGAMLIFDKFSSNGFKSLGGAKTAMVALAAAVLILATALKKIASIDAERLEDSLTAITILIGEMVASCIILSKYGGKVQTSAVGMILFAESIKILAGAVKKLADIDANSITQGLVAVGVLMAELVAFMNGAKGGKLSVGQGAAILELAVALNVMQKAVAGFGGMSLQDLGKGLVAVGVALAAVTAAMNLMPKNVAGIGAGMLIMSAALNAIVLAVKSAAGLEWDEIGRGLTVVGVSLGILAVALNAMNGTLAGSAALLVAAGALAVLTPSLMLLSTLSLGGMVTALITMAGAFTVLGVAGALLGPLAPAILALCGALTLLGVGVLAIGAGIAAFGIGVASFVTAMLTVAASIEAFKAAVVVAVPFIASAIAQGIITFVQTIAEGAKTLATAVVSVVQEVLAALTTALPTIFNFITTALSGLMSTLETLVPQFIELGITLILSLLNAIADNIQSIVEAGMSIVIGFIEGIAAKLPELIQAAVDLVISFINGLADGITNNQDRVVSAVNNLMNAIIGAMAAFVTNFLQMGVNFVVNLGQGILSVISGVVSIALDLIGQVLAAIGVPEEFITVGQNLIQGLIDGILGMASSVLDAIGNIAETVLGGIKSALGINSPSTEAMDIGQYFDQGLIDGLKSGEVDITTTAQSLADSSLTGMTYNSESFSAAGSEASSGFASGLLSNSESVSQSAQSLADGANTGLNYNNSSYAQAGQDVSTQYSASIDPVAANDAASQLGENTIDSLKKAVAEPIPSDIGKGIVQGLIDGLNATTGQAQTTMSTFCKTFVESTRTALQASGFNTIGQNAMQGLIAGLNAKRPLALSTVQNICQAIITQFKTSLPSATFNQIAQNQIMQSIINGMNAKRPLAVSTAQNICQAITTAFRNGLSSATFNAMGQSVVQAIINGMNSKKSEAASAASDIAKAIIDAFQKGLTNHNLNQEGAKIVTELINGIKSQRQAAYDAAYDVGSYAGEGLRRGLESKINSIRDAAIRAAREAIEAAKREMQEESPSKVFFQIGAYASIGMANGIAEYASEASDASEDMAGGTINVVKKAMDAVHDIMDGDADFTPTITPVIDLSQVQNGVRTMNGMFGTRGINMSATYDRAVAAGTYNPSISPLSAIQQSSQSTTNNNAKYEFNQYNYSPKSLSQIDIYRNTRNQFSQFREAVSIA